MIYLGSRYQGRVIDTQKDTAGNVQLSVLRMVMPTTPMSSRAHIWKDSDRIDRIALEYLGNGDRWWDIMDINPDIIDPLRIAPGTVLRIPNA